MMRLIASFNKEHRQVRLGLRGSPVYYWLSLASSVDAEGREEQCRLRDVRLARGARGQWSAEVRWSSSLWRSKTHHYRFNGKRLLHWVELRGRGRITHLTFGSGTVDGAEEGSVPGFGMVYNATPNFLDKPWSHPSEYTAISAGNVTELWGSALNGGPLMFAFGEYEGVGWIGAGVLARPGRYGFHTMAFNRKRQATLNTHDHIVGTQAVSLDYLGNEKVDGRWVSPKLVLFEGSSASDCLKRYCREVYAGGCASTPVSRRATWWKRPIFCTWHEQVALARRGSRGPAGRLELEGGASSFDQITEKRTRHWLKQFERRGIRFGTVILDAKWQKDDGSNEADPAKFPDLRGFVDDLHRRGYRVILWMQAWEMKGIPRAWCMTQRGEPLMADPTHPAYREHTRRMVRRMLGSGPGEYHADGLKIDGTNVLPGGPGLRNRGGQYGFELLHAYLKLMYDAAKAVKPDALIDLYGANPYMADCCDMVRLGDLYTFRGDPIHTMRWRAETYRAGLPHALIETDGALRFSVRDDTRELLEEQSKLGVLCVYQAEYLLKNRALARQTIRKITPKEYRVLSRAVKTQNLRVRA